MLTYFDYNATAPVRPAVRQAMIEALDLEGNPSSVHRAGRVARRVIEDARQKVADLTGAAPRNVVFTSGGTEANNLALRGLKAKHLIVSAIEHDCVFEAAAAAGCPVSLLKVNSDGVADLAHLEALLSEVGEGTVVSLMAVNNETGVIQPVTEVAALAHEAGALFHTDAVQALGKIDLGPIAFACDLITLSAHKVGGAKGAGALVVRDGIELAPMIVGGGQEMRRRSGTENLPAIAGFGALLGSDFAVEHSKVERMRAQIEDALTSAVPDALIVGQGAARVGNTICVALPGVKAETQVMALDLAGIAVSAGSACSSGKVSRSHVLAAMGHNDVTAGSALRISWGWATSQADFDRLIAEWTAMANRLYCGKHAQAVANG